MGPAHDRGQRTVRDLEPLDPAVQRVHHTTRERTLIRQFVGEVTPPIERRTVVAARLIVARSLLGHPTSVPTATAAGNLRPTIVGLLTRRDFDDVHRRRRSHPRRAVQNDTRWEQPGQDDTNAPRSVA